MTLKKNYNKKDISDRTVLRLTLYLSILKDLEKKQTEVNSVELANKMNSTAVQVRKDLSTFGEFGTRGKGYSISDLINVIEQILGINQENEIILVGYGKMGSMISYNTNVLGKGFKLVGVFDNNEKKIGEELKHLNISVLSICKLEEFIVKNRINTAILSVNTEYAQEVADKLISYGIKAILNMAACKLEVPENIVVVNSDISAKLQELNFWRINCNGGFKNE